MVALSSPGLSQSAKVDLFDLFARSRGVSLDTTDMASLFVDRDFSKLLLANQESRLGFIGEHYRRFYIHFLSCSKDAHDPTLYHVKGKTRVGRNICDFVGTMELNSIHRLHDPEKCENEVRPETEAVTVFNYTFSEDPHQNHVGVFTGSAMSQWYLDSLGNVCYDDLWSCSDSYQNNSFIGTWAPYDSTLHKTCNWGDNRIPLSGDLDIGAGYFWPNDKYVGNGWQSYHDAYDFPKGDKQALQLEKAPWWNP